MESTRGTPVKRGNVPALPQDFAVCSGVDVVLVHFDNLVFALAFFRRFAVALSVSLRSLALVACGGALSFCRLALCRCRFAHFRLCVRRLLLGAWQHNGRHNSKGTVWKLRPATGTGLRFGSELPQVKQRPSMQTSW